MKKFILLFMILNLNLELKSFGQWGNIWINNGCNFQMDFNSGPPIITMPTNSSSQEANSTICDNNGQLLIYSNSLNVYDRNLNLMLNGDSIGGNISSSQGVVVLPKPGSVNEYYLFTIDQNPSAGFTNNGLMWSLLDLTLNAGLGEVVTKRNHLLDSCYEKITATRHCNGNDWWVVVHPWSTNKFYTYLVDGIGISNSPIISQIGSVLNDSTGTFGNSLGQMKISSNGNYIAIVNALKNLEVFHFNNETGIIQDTILMDFSPLDSIIGRYALSFSPSGNVLYSQSNGMIKDIFQYNLVSNNPQSVLNSKTAIFNLPNGSNINTFNFAASLGPDGKIYFVTEDTIGGSNYCALSVVNKPNLLGLACEMVPQQHLITGANFFALPHYPDCIFARKHTASLHIPTCVNTDSTLVVFDTLLNVVHDITWDFGDPASGVNNTYEGTDPYHLFTAPGTYTITLTFTNRCNQFVISRDVFIPNTTPPAVPSIVLNAAFLEASVAPNYQWYLNDSIIFGANNFAYAPTQNGIYTVSTTQNGCTVFSLPFQLATVALEAMKKINSFSLLQTNELVTLQCNPITDCFQSVELIDLQGRVLQTYAFQQKQSKVEISISELQSGVYFLRVNGREVRKVLKE
jgi:hypothetical protein